MIFSIKGLLSLPTIGAAIIGIAVMALPASAQNIINIDATLYGYNPVGPTLPPTGAVITPFSLAAGGILDQLTLGPGTYSVTNASGLPGANPSFTAWRRDSGSADWQWNYVIANNMNDEVVNGGFPATGSSQLAVASDPSVQNYSSTFTLPTTTTLDFMASDYYLTDNAGGVALLVQPLASSVPEASSCALLVLGLLPLAVLAAHKRKNV